MKAGQPFFLRFEISIKLESKNCGLKTLSLHVFFLQQEATLMPAVHSSLSIICLQPRETRIQCSTLQHYVLLICRELWNPCIPLFLITNRWIFIYYSLFPTRALTGRKLCFITALSLNQSAPSKPYTKKGYENSIKNCIGSFFL